MFCLYIVHDFLSSMEDINAFKSSRVSGVTVRSDNIYNLLFVY